MTKIYTRRLRCNLRGYLGSQEWHDIDGVAGFFEEHGAMHLWIRIKEDPGGWILMPIPWLQLEASVDRYRALKQKSKRKARHRRRRRFTASNPS